jgi:hypothetical protein
VGWVRRRFGQRGSWPETGSSPEPRVCADAILGIKPTSSFIAVAVAVQIIAVRKSIITDFTYLCLAFWLECICTLFLQVKCKSDLTSFFFLPRTT